MNNYEAFLASKVVSIPQLGFDVDRGEVNPLLKPHQIDSVIWAVKGGRRAWFESFGLGCELSPSYFLDSCYYAKAAEQKRNAPGLFDIIDGGKITEKIA